MASPDNSDTQRYSSLRRVLLRCLAATPGRPGFVKRYPTMPAVSRISFDFLHYIRPPTASAAAPKDSFEQLVHFLRSWNCRPNGLCAGDDIGHGGGGAGENCASIKIEDVNGRNARRDERTKRKRNGLTVNLLRNLCHVFYFNCNQVR